MYTVSDTPVPGNHSGLSVPYNGAREKGLTDEGDLMMGLACPMNEHAVGSGVSRELTGRGV